MNKVIITETDNFIKYSTSNPDFAVSNGYLTGDEIVVPISSNLPKESFALIPKYLVPSEEYFAENSEYADGGLWDSVQNYGNQKDYSYACANWGASKMIIPKYPLTDIDKCMYALKDCSGLEDGRNLVFHITNENPNMLYVCANCGNMVYAPRFVFYNAPIIKNYMSMYAGCLNLKEVYVHWGDGSTDPIAERTSCQNMFFKCARLEDMYFTGVGSPMYLDLSYSKYIKYSALLSLGKSLAVIDSTEAARKNSVHEITLSATTAAMLRGEIAVTEDDITVENIEDYSESTEIPDMGMSRQIIPYLDSMEYMTNISFEIEIIPEVEQSTDQNFCVQLYRNFNEGVFFTTTPNTLIQRVSISMMSEGFLGDKTIWWKRFEDYEIASGIRACLVNFTAPCTIKIHNLRYTYCRNDGVITSKGWNIVEQERADNIVM